MSFYRQYSTTILLTPAYSLGFCASLFLIVQVVTGFLLASLFIPTTDDAFEVIHSSLMSDLDSGWLLSVMHANGAALFFVAIYAHMFSTLYHASSYKTSVWFIGVLMYLFLCAICFTGYSLVFGQMSLWAIVVICSLVTAMPVIGGDLLTLIWGGNVVSTATLQSVFCVHFLLPFLLCGFTMLHLFFLHDVNSTGESYFVLNSCDSINFYPLLLISDILVGSVLLSVYMWCVCFDSDVMGHPDNYVPANPMVTPAEIMPEWYFLPFYAILSAIPHKALGICVLVVVLTGFMSIASETSHHWAGSGVLGSALLLVLVFDLSIASFLCMMVNHGESMYWLLLVCAFGIFGL